MAVLYVTEYSGIGYVGLGATPVAPSPALATQTVAIGGSSTASAAFGASTNLIRVHTDAICSVVIGKTGANNTPTATTTSQRMSANQTEYFVVNPGDKLAVISNT